MKKLQLYKHSNNTDVAILVLRSRKWANGTELKVQWWNIVNPNNIFYTGEQEVIVIPEEQLSNWKPYDHRND